jgi:hypothetical protein
MLKGIVLIGFELVLSSSSLWIVPLPAGWPAMDGRYYFFAHFRHLSAHL